MTALSRLLPQNRHWLEFSSAVASGAVPAAIGAEVRSVWQREFVQKCARVILCEHGAACGTCPACRAWAEDAHPDLLVAGEPDAPAGVDECRRKSSDLSLSPVVSPRRLLVFYAAEKMSLPAVNSLLKITEEPPPRGHILYVMNKADILPTLRSRLWTLSLNAEESVVRIEPPGDRSGWLRWLRGNEKNDVQSWYALALGYAAWYAGNGRFDLAAQLQQLAETAMTTHLSAPMWADLLFLHMRGEYPFEDVFDDFRQAPLPRPRERR